MKRLFVFSAVVVGLLSTQQSAVSLANQRLSQRPHSLVNVPGSSGAANWPQFGYDAAHAGFNPLESTLGVNNVGQLRQTWSFSTGAGNDALNVVESDGILYVESQNGTLFAVNAATGAEIWSYATGSGYGPNLGVAAVDAGLVFTDCSDASASEGLCALSATSGALVWSFPVLGTATYAETPPAVAYGKVYFGACSSSCAFYALDENTGSLAWSQDESGQQCPLNGANPLALYQKRVFAGVMCGENANGEIVAMKATNGRTLWSYPVQGSVEGLAAASRSVIFTSSTFNGALYSFQRGAWWIESAAGGGAMPAVAYQKLFIPSAGYLTAWRYSKRVHPVWSTENLTSAAIANQVVYSLNQGYPWAVSASNGGFLWGTMSGTPSVGSPIVVNAAVYGACQGSNLCAWSIP